MVKLFDEDVETREVLDWKGVHLFHFYFSSCSQKARICFNLKGIQYRSHPVNLADGENYTQFYLGINPRGLVPALVIDGEVHIESNDIITHVDHKFPDIPLIPAGMEDETALLLKEEDELHLDLRTLTFRFTWPRGKVARSPETLQKYREFGSGTVEGEIDTHKNREIKFWEIEANIGITDEAVRVSIGRFKDSLTRLSDKLQGSPYLLGENITVLDVAWVIYVNRLVFCGYPLDNLHPIVGDWFWPLREKDEFDRELIIPPDLQKTVDENHSAQADAGKSLVEVAGL